jgi:hypothetical protein
MSIIRTALANAKKENIVRIKAQPNHVFESVSSIISTVDIAIRGGIAPASGRDVLQAREDRFARVLVEIIESMWDGTRDGTSDLPLGSQVDSAALLSARANSTKEAMRHPESKRIMPDIDNYTAILNDVRLRLLAAHGGQRSLDRINAFLLYLVGAQDAPEGAIDGVLHAFDTAPIYLIGTTDQAGTAGGTVTFDAQWVNADTIEWQVLRDGDWITIVNPAPEADTVTLDVVADAPTGSEVLIGERIRSAGVNAKGATVGASGEITQA